MADFRLGRIKFKWQGDWTAATGYEKDDVVNYNGTSWVCVVNHTSDATNFLDDRDTKWEVMIRGINFAGTWSSSTTYETNDVVYYNGSSWLSTVDNNTNSTPTGASSDWAEFAQGAAELTTLGDMLVRGSTANERLPIGTESSVLQVVSGEPSWSSNLTLNGTIGATDATLSGDLAVNGADVTSTATTFNLLNATVTTLNVGGAADVNIGGASKTVTIGNDIDVNGTIYQGSDPITQETTDGLTNSSAVLIGNVNAFSQVAHKNINAGSGASTDFIAYADNGDNDSGWIDMGITSSTFDDPTYGVTGINDGYIFMSAPDLVTPLGNGNLYISTSGYGLQNDIVFSTGGFEDNTYERMRVVGTAHGSYNAGINLVDDISTTNGKFYIGPNAKDLTVDGSTASTQLDGGINSTNTTITVDSTAGFNSAGYVTIGDEVIFYESKTATTFTNCNRGYQGTTAASHLDNAVVEQITYVGLTNATAIYTGNADDFVQFAIKNTNSGASASTDLIAYASDGDNDSGWIDLGITSATYSDPAFTVTGPGTGYLFFSAPATTSGTGDLLIGTDHTGSNNDIVFFTNGFDAGNERLRIVGTGANAGVAIYADTESTSTTTGALRVEGGIGLLGNLNVGGDVNIVGNITLGGTGNTVETESLAVADPIIRMANGNSTSDTLDIGFVGTYGSSGAKYTGLVRDASDGVYKLFTDLSTNPTTTVDFTGATFASVKTGAFESSSSVTSVGVTSTGTIAVNASGGITTNQTTFPLVNTTATTVNFAGAATAVNIGASTGTTTINNDLDLASGKVLKIAGTQVLSGSALGSGITSSSLTSLGTITSLSAGTVSATGTISSSAVTGFSTTVSGGTALRMYGSATATSQWDMYLNGANLRFSNNTGGSGVVKIDSGLTVDGNMSTGAGFVEAVNVSGSAPTATQAYALATQAFTYHTANAANNWVANLTGLSALSTGQSATFAIMATQGSTAYYVTSVQVDGTTAGVTTRWAGGAPTAGNPSGVDIYNFTVVKTGASAYTVIGSLTAFN